MPHGAGIAFEFCILLIHEHEHEHDTHQQTRADFVREQPCKESI